MRSSAAAISETPLATRSSWPSRSASSVIAASAAFATFGSAAASSLMRSPSVASACALFMSLCPLRLCGGNLDSALQELGAAVHPAGRVGRLVRMAGDEAADEAQALRQEP